MDGIWITELGPAAGKRLAVKDLFDTAGIRTTYGSAVFSDHVPRRVPAPSPGSRLEAGSTRARRTCTSSPTASRRRTCTTASCRIRRIRAGRRAGRAAGRRRPSRWGSSRERSGRTRAGRSGSRPPAAGSRGSSRASEPCRSTASSRSQPSFDHAGPMARDVAGCIDLMRDLVPGFQVAELRDPRVGIAWPNRCDPLVRERVLAAARVFGDVVEVEFPLAESVVPAFMREVADVHREPVRREQRAVRREHPGQDRTLPCSHGERVSSTLSTSARGTAKPRRRPSTASTCCSRRRSRSVPKPVGVDRDRDPRPADAVHVPVQRAGLARARVPVGAAEEGLPASLQIVGRRGEDGVVLAAGLALEASL